MTLTQQPSPDWNMVTLKWWGTYLDGQPATGLIELSYDSGLPLLDDDPSTPLAVFVAGISIPIGTTTISINGVDREVGYVSIQVPASNDPDIIGSGGTYVFSEKLRKGGGRQDVHFVADKDAPGGVIFINRLYGDPAAPADPVSVVQYAEFAAVRDDVDELKQGGGGGVSTWDELGEKPLTFPPSAHNHDDRYFTEAEADGRYAATGHNHDSRYFTETESDARFATTAQGAKADSAVQPAALTTKADLVGGVVPSSQLPAYVDDVLEFANLAAFPATGESGKLYNALDTLKLYRWSGSAYAVVSDTIALGETSATAYRGDRGKTAYDHSQVTTGNPHGTTATDVGAEPTQTAATQTEAEAGTSTSIRKWSPLRVAQAIAAQLPSTSLGRQLLAAANAAAARTALGVDLVTIDAVIRYGTGAVPDRSTVTSDTSRRARWVGQADPFAANKAITGDVWEKAQA